MKKLFILAVLSAFGIATLSAQNGRCIAKADNRYSIAEKTICSIFAE